MKTSSNNPAAQFGDYWRLMRMDKPVGIYLLLWPTLWGLWFAADGVPPLKILLIFIAGTVVMRAAGCVINDYADRDFDQHVSRTKDRPITSGKVASKDALRLFLVMCLIAFGLVTQLGMKVVLMSLPALLLAISYPYAKRIHHLPQAHLGLAFAWSIPMAWVAFERTDWILASMLVLATVCWAVAYDTFYAMVDKADDLRIGVRSSAILFGDKVEIICALCLAASLSLLLVAGLNQHFGMPYYLGLAGATALSVWQIKKLSTRESDNCFQAFKQSHWFGAVIFAGLAAEYWVN